MCSIQEAWGDFKPETDNKIANLVKNSKEQQLQLQNERQPSSVPGSNPPDSVGNSVIQANDYRQFSRAENDYHNPNFQQHWNSKPSPSMNGMTRGVHNKYSRDKRMDFKQHQSHIGTLETDVDVKHYLQTEDNKPPYLDLYDKPSNEMPGVGPLARLQPMAANADEETYMDVSENFYGKELEKMGNNSFTPEIITDPKLLQEANNAKKQLHLNNTTNSVTDSNAIPDEIKKLQQEIKHLMSKIDVLENKVKNVENNTNHDIILFLVVAIFILFVIDNVFKFNKLS